MSFSDIVFIVAGLLGLAASIAVYVYAKGLERRRLNRATVATAEKASR